MRWSLLVALAAFPALAWGEWSRASLDGSPVQFDAYSVRAPAGSGWLVSRGGAYDIGFAAVLTRSHSWSMTAAAIPLAGRYERPEALLAHVQAKFVADSDPLRYRIVRSEGRAQMLHGAACARTYFKAEDRLAGGEAAHYVIELTLLTCQHPSAPGLAIEVGYHERYLPGEAGGHYRELGERFIRSVRFWRPV